MWGVHRARSSVYAELSDKGGHEGLFGVDPLCFAYQRSRGRVTRALGGVVRTHKVRVAWKALRVPLEAEPSSLEEVSWARRVVE